ncbi:MAG: hypothetical protein R6U44_10805 [Archaeoglobaceae archaeon]
MVSERLPKLAGFVKSLENVGFIFNVNRFNHRLKLQKFVYLARRFGLNLGYGYNLYIHGPYSPVLADDYYRLDENVTKEHVELPEEFFKLVNKKSETWLELAATLIMIEERNPGMNDEDKINLVLSNKPFADRETLKDVLRSLYKHKAI